MNQLKAIETVYRGYRFRSRLEARWAVFFDTLGVRWEYEKEGYDLGPAGWYLPDFWLPDHQYWIEIKGPHPTITELTRLEAIFDLTGYPSLLFYGEPTSHPGFGWRFDVKDSSAGPHREDDVEWFVCSGCMRVDVTIGDDVRDIINPNHWGGDDNNIDPHINTCWGHCAPLKGAYGHDDIDRIAIRPSFAHKLPFVWPQTDNAERLEQAVFAARQARFEFSETFKR